MPRVKDLIQKANKAIEDSKDSGLGQNRNIHTLKGQRQKRKFRYETEEEIQQPRNKYYISPVVRFKETSHSQDSTPEENKKDDFEIEKIRNALFRSVYRNNATECQQLRNRVTKLCLTLSDEKLRIKEDNMTVLHYALEIRSWNVAENLINTGNEKFLTDDYNIIVCNKASRKSCLHILSEKGHYELTKLFLKRLTIEAAEEELTKPILTELEGQDQRNLTSMHLAALNGHSKLIELYHNFGGDIDITSEKNDTPVLLAAARNHIETVRKLIKLGAYLEQEDDEGSTPLDWAIRNGSVELVEILINEGKVNGMVPPIILASAFGHHKIVELLLENGADANVKIKNDWTALHFAAIKGNVEVMKLLLGKCEEDINHANNNGDTAILFAAKAGNIETMNLLAEKGAKKDLKNKMGHNIWYYATHQSNKEFLKAVVQLYKEDKITPDFILDGTLLHDAASKGDLEMIMCLMDMEVDPQERDEKGNTFFHVAASEGKFQVVEAFLSKFDVNDTNDEGDTALHLACKNGHIRTSQILLQKTKLDETNDFDMTSLHLGVGSDAASSKLIRILGDKNVKTNDQDQDGNSDEHITSRHEEMEIYPQACSYPIYSDKSSPSRIAAKKSRLPLNLEKMMDIFNKPEREVNIDQKNYDGDSCLHICARNGDEHGVMLLVSCGADLAVKNNQENTAIHGVIKESADNQKKKEDFLEVFRAITRVSPLWWCKKKKKEEKYPKEESYYYNFLLREAMLYLTSEICNKDGLNAVEYAIEMKAVDMLEEIFNTPNVYRFRDTWNCSYEFDITDFIPETTGEGQKKMKQFLKKGCRAGGDNNCVENETKNQEKEKSYPALLSKVHIDEGDCEHKNTKQKGDKTYIDRILSLEDDGAKSKILEINPFKQMMSNPYQWLCAILMLVHIVYMGLFSVYVFPVSDELYKRNKTTTVSGCQSSGTNGVYGLFLIWPVLILLYEIYSVYTTILDLNEILKSDETPDNAFFRGITRFYKKIKDFIYDSVCLRICFVIIFFILYVIYEYFMNIETLISLAFCGLSIAWYVLFQCPSDMTIYVEIVSMVLVIGWLYTIIFTKGFEGMHSYSIMLKRIIWQDITRYLIMYVFFLLGCGMAFAALFQIVPSSGCTESSYFHASIWITLFNVFSLMLGLESLFDESFDDCYATYGGNPAFVRCLYVFYIICATIILINLLISMMSDTYRNIKEKEDSTWKVGNIVLARRIERSLPFIKRLRQGTHIIRDKIFFDDSTKRWMIEIPSHKMEPLKVREKDQLQRTVERLENKMDELKEFCVDLSRQIKSKRSTTLQ